MPRDGAYALSADMETAEQIREIEVSRGTRGLILEGARVVVISSLGARSGALRKNLVIRVEHHGRYAVIASRGGDTRRPDWYRNLSAYPCCQLQDAAQRREYAVRELAGDERALWWKRATTVWPAYDDDARAAERVIPVLLLEPTTSQAAQSIAPPSPRLSDRSVK